MDTNDAPELSLFNIVGGCADERFRRELALVMDNWIDANTEATTKRTITMEFSFLPFEDRSGSAVSLTVKSKMAAGDSVTGTVFLTRRNDDIVAVPFDPKQDRLFTEPETLNQEKRK